MAAISISKLQQSIHSLRNKLNADFVSVLKFWLKYSIDNEHGGYFNCINDDGTIYDGTKYVWLQCRAVWMFFRLYTNEILTNINDKVLKRDIYIAAKHGIDFITKNVIFVDKKTNLHRCYFSIDRKGNGLTIQRKIFSECFFVMALISYSSVIYKTYSKLNDLLDNAMIEQQLKDADNKLILAMNVFKDIQTYINDPQLLGYKYQPNIAENKQFEALNIPMICLNIIDEFKSLISAKHRLHKQNISYLNDLAEKYMDDIIKHIDFKNKCLRENVCKDGTFDDGTSDGRMVNPGHAIEASWFLKQYVGKYGNEKRKKYIDGLTRDIFEWSMDMGWDGENGGIFAFVDALDYPLVLLESNMKLWWPCNEAMICSLLLFKDSMENNHGLSSDVQNDWNMVELVCNYCLNVFSDGTRGGWYGYFKSNSEIELSIKGGPYKGFFHVPRSLMFAVNILDDIIQYITKQKALQAKL